MVVLGHSAFTLGDLLLVVLVLPVVGGDDLALGGLDTRVPWDKDGLYTESIWVDVEEDNLTWVLIIGKNGSLIWVDELAIEKSLTISWILGILVRQKHEMPLLYFITSLYF